MDVENGNDIITQETIRDDLKKIVETEKVFKPIYRYILLSC